jgi:hypothetical protein
MILATSRNKICKVMILSFISLFPFKKVGLQRRLAINVK